MTTYAREPRTLRHRAALVLMVAALALTGCANAGGTPHGTPTSTGPLLAFTGTTVDGKPFDGASLTGKPTVLWFWAPWCPVCLQQAPGVRAAAQQYAGKVNIVGVAGLDKAANMPEFVRLAKIADLTSVADEAGVIYKRFKVTSQQTFVVVSPTGDVTYKGRIRPEDVQQKLAALVG